MERATTDEATAFGASCSDDFSSFFATILSPHYSRKTARLHAISILSRVILRSHFRDDLVAIVGHQDVASRGRRCGRLALEPDARTGRGSALYRGRLFCYGLYSTRAERTICAKSPPDEKHRDDAECYGSGDSATLVVRPLLQCFYFPERAFDDHIMMRALRPRSVFLRHRAV